MRLTKKQIAAIRQATREVYGDNSQVWLFGSRVDDNRRGGDIDLLIRPEIANKSVGLMRKIQFLGKLERAMGERKIDVIIEADDDSRSIIRVAHETGLRL